MTLVFDVVVGTMFTGLVFHDPLLTVRLEERVDTLGVVMVPRLPLALDVVVFQVMNGIVVVVVWWCLAIKPMSRKQRFSIFLPGSQCILPSGVLLHRLLAHRLPPLGLRLEELHPEKHPVSTKT